MKEETLRGADGLELFMRAWRPSGKPRAVMVIVPGFNAHSGRYRWAAEELVAAGLAVYAIDLRGRGKSQGERFYVEKVSDYVDDVATLVSAVKSREPGLPLFLLGHSAGGVVACTYTLDHQAELAGFICESFAYKVPAPDFALAVLKGLSHVAPHAHSVKLKNEDFSRDPEVVAEMNADPLIANESQPFKTMAALVHADERLGKAFGTITLPVLILHGTADKATKPSGSKQFYELAGSTDKTLKLYDGAFHDLLNDLDKQTVMADVQRWVDAHILQR
jgi:alpha-beta hydrolase superfamily lysophospholipase